MNITDLDKTQYTPMMQQYIEIKKDYSDAIVFFRLGDFYEMFFEDALLASRELEIALTGRDAGAKERVPMCGVPHHAASSYLERLVQKGYRVAIVEQTEEATPGKGLVKREVVKIVTPGTILELNALNDKENNYVLAIHEEQQLFDLAYADLSTGDLFMTSCAKTAEALTQSVLNVRAKEIVLSKALNDKFTRKLHAHFGVLLSYEETVEPIPFIKGLLTDNNVQPKALTRLVHYLRKTQKQDLSHLKPVKTVMVKDSLHMDFFSKRNLELVESLRGNPKANLLSLLDKCQTAMGSRLLRKWIEIPLRNQELIEKRLNSVEAFMKDYVKRQDIMDALKTVYDLERIVSRIGVNQANAKDLVQLRRSLSHIPEIKHAMMQFANPHLQQLGASIDPHEALYERLEKALVDQPSLTLKEGNLFKRGYDPTLDALLEASENGKTWIAELELKERERTGIKTLKVGYNRVFGYYIEITKSNVALLDSSIPYERKQTLANAERYITPELKEKEALILGAADKSMDLEYELFLALRAYTASFIASLQMLADTLSEIDVLSNFASISESKKYVKPQFSSTRDVIITQARHPVVEALSEEVFVKNDIHIDARNILIITGPNMSGKSTYMRQFALIVVMAQMGCFVPADKALLPIYDQIFTRIGSSDDLSSGQSTFMVEMLEANNALSHATHESLILFDEIGRGTATYDGMALAQAIIEYVHEKIKATTLFSTHYHELTLLDKELKHVRNIHVLAKEEKKGIVFLHKVEEGPTDKSYGIHVAQLANLPRVVIERSKHILQALESASNSKKVNIDLFNFEAYEETIEVNQGNDAYEQVIDDLLLANIDAMTPIEALNYLYALKERLKK